MIKFLLAATVSVFALTATIDVADAKPKQTQHVLVKKNKKKSKKVVAKKVAPVAAAVATATVLLYDDENPAGFFMNDRLRREVSPEVVEYDNYTDQMPPTKPSKKGKQQKTLEIGRAHV